LDKSRVTGTYRDHWGKRQAGRAGNRGEAKKISPVDAWVRLARFFPFAHRERVPAWRIRLLVVAASQGLTSTGTVVFSFIDHIPLSWRSERPI
jgi:hypothetical protein